MNVTIRLFDQDSHQTDFSAVVLSCLPVQEALKEHTEHGASGILPDQIPKFSKSGKDRYLVVLDRTLFFPEGGGQTADTGMLAIAPAAGPESSDFPTHSAALCGETESAIHVLDVQERNGVIFHLTDRPVPSGSTVAGRIDWQQRFDRMQQHSGEHIFSGLVHGRYGYDNVGFHLGEEETTLDFSGPLTGEQIAEVERDVNRAVTANLPVLVHYPSRSELPSLTYRSKIEIEGQVRLVEIPGYDMCACCAPHVRYTGEIGLVKVVRWMNNRGGVRITILCGMRAFRDYCAKDASVKDISVLLSAKETRISSAVRHLQEEIYGLRGQIMQMTQERLERELSALSMQEQDPLFILEDLPTDQVR